AAGGGEVEPTRPGLAKPALALMEELEPGFGGQGRDPLPQPLNLQRQAPLPGDGRLVAAMALDRGAERQTALGVDPIMRVARGRGQQAGADKGAAIDRDPRGVGAAARGRALVDGAVQVAAGKTEIDILRNRADKPGEKAAGGAAEAGDRPAPVDRGEAANAAEPGPLRSPRLRPPRSQI